MNIISEGDLLDKVPGIRRDKGKTADRQSPGAPCIGDTVKREV